MPIDREQTLKQAEKLLRQGRLEAAIAAYGRVVAECPRDWATANLLGDLYVRAGDVRLASQQYARVADHLAAEGFVAKAAALYKKVLKLEPADETALLRSAELAAAQGLVADVRAYFSVLFQQRLKRGDRDGARALAAKRVSLDPADVVGHLDAARMLAEAGDGAGAAAELRVAGLALESQNRLPEATRALRESLRFDGRGDETRPVLIRILLNQGDVSSAAECAQTPGHLRELVGELDRRSLGAAAHQLLEKLVAMDPADVDARLQLASRCLAADDPDGAEGWLANGVDAASPAAALLRAELAFRHGQVDDGVTQVSDLLASDRDATSKVIDLADRVAVSNPDAGGAVLAAVVERAMGSHEAEWVRVRLLAFVARAPDSVVAWRKLIDVCVDGGFDTDLHAAQLQLADALLRRNAWHEAMAVAEDLVASDPDDVRHVERLRQAMVGLGLDPAEALARILHEPVEGDLDPVLPPGDAGRAPDGRNSVLSDDFSDLVALLSAPSGSDAPDSTDDGRLAVPPGPAWAQTPGRDDMGAPAFSRGSSATGTPREFTIFDDDLRRLFEEEGAPATTEQADAAFEIDLSQALQEMGAPEAGEVLGEATVEHDPEGRDALPAVADTHVEAPDLDAFFQTLRDEVVADSRVTGAHRLFDEGQASYAAGQAEQAMVQLRAAAREPGLRLRSALLIARISREQGNVTEAIEWLERAAEVPAPSLDAWQGLLYELADTLELAGEETRALAVLMELRAATPGYRDVDQRIAVLSARPSGWARDSSERPT